MLAASCMCCVSTGIENIADFDRYGLQKLCGGLCLAARTLQRLQAQRVFAARHRDAALIHGYHFARVAAFVRLAAFVQTQLSLPNFYRYTVQVGMTHRKEIVCAHRAFDLPRILPPVDLRFALEPV